LKYVIAYGKSGGATMTRCSSSTLAGFFREKGIFELVDAGSLAANRDPRITCVLVGSSPDYAETTAVIRKLHKIPDIKQKVKLLPHCDPNEVWQYLCAADIFAFTSHNEGMPNSLLEAMAMGVPAIAFAIQPVLELEAGTGALVTVTPFDSTLFAKAILRLATSSEERALIPEKGRARVDERFMVAKNMAKAIQCLEQVAETYRACNGASCKQYS